MIDYLYRGKRETKTVEAPELERGIPFPHDEIISIHSQEPTLEDMFIQYTGRGQSFLNRAQNPFHIRTAPSLCTG